jgi:hypothetical protein
MLAINIINMRYRGTSKIKRKHHLIDDLEHFLDAIESWPEIHSIIPGIITLCRHNDRLKVTIQNHLPHGVRCLARSHGAVQEIFFISTDVSALLTRLSNFLEAES